MSKVMIKSYINELGNEVFPAVLQKEEVSCVPKTGQQLRQIAVDYMYRMANVVWVSSQRIDYSFNNPALIYEPGTTYVGMIYNNRKTGFEDFSEALDEKGVYRLEDIGWDTAPGNSCATSIKHAWQLISPDVEYLYSINMMPSYPETKVLPVGNIDWTQYDGHNTTLSIRDRTDKKEILEAYALAQPADGFMRYLDTGGHALMVTLPPVVVRDTQGNIDPENSFVFLTDQNNRIHDRREYPSSWQVDHEVSFEKAYTDGWLPVTVKELCQGNAPEPVFQVEKQPTGASLGGGHGLTAVVKCNYCIMTLSARLQEATAEGKLLRMAQAHPYTREVSLEAWTEKLQLDALPGGQYHLSVSAQVGLGSAQLFEVDFSR